MGHACVVELFILPVDVKRDVQRDFAREANVVVEANRCPATNSLADAGIRDRSCLLAC